MASDISLALQQLNTDENTDDLLRHGFILVGHSMGAKVALATLSELPAPLLQELKGLVLVAPAPPTALDLPPKMKEQQKEAYSTAQSVRWTVENVLAEPKNLTEQDIETVIQDSLSGNQLAKIAWPTYGMAEDVSDGVRKALASIQNIGLRASILVGELDVVEPKERVETEVRGFLEANGVQVSLKVIESVKHLIPLESPEAINEEILRY
ncbi:hypothetical protein BBP40_001363 [Aspergillus hancockii]|nr:hypothetical protein BBP40_001363 [Aspergillus hancockii]